MGNTKSSDSNLGTPSPTSRSNSSTNPPSRSQNNVYSLIETETPQRVRYLPSTISSSNRSTISSTGIHSSGVIGYSNHRAEEQRREVPFSIHSTNSGRERIDAIQRLREHSTEFNNVISANYSTSTQYKLQPQNDHAKYKENTTKVAPVKTGVPKTISPSSTTAIYESQLRARSQNGLSENTDTAHFIQSSVAKLYQQQLEVKSQKQPSETSSTEPEIASASKLFAMQLSLKSQNQLDNMVNLNINHFADEAKGMLRKSEASNSSNKGEENNLDKMSVVESETPSDSDNISWGTRSSDEEKSSDSQDEATTTGPSTMDLFTSLMPKATNENKEIITLASGQLVLNEKENHLRRMLNSTFLLEYLANYIMKKEATLMKVYLKDISDIEQKCQKSFIRVLQYYPGFTFDEKLMDFIESFNYVFIVDEKNKKQISVNHSAKNYVDEAHKRLVKELVLFCIEEGKKDIESISEYVKEMFQQEPFNRYANVTTEQLNLLISKYPNELHVDRHQQVHIVENLSIDNSSVNETKSAQSEVVAFFERELQSIPSGLFFKDLPRVLSWKKPELLANLSGRNAQSIFKILAANSLFEAKDNYISLKSAKMKEGQKNIITYDNTFLKSLAHKSITRPTMPGLQRYYDMLDIFLPETDDITRFDKYTLTKKTPETQPKMEDSETSTCCMVGTVFSLSSVQGSIWCSPGSNSKTVLVLCTLKTIINGKQVIDLKRVLKVGDKVLFSASSADVGGLIKWNALHLKTTSDPSIKKECVSCMKTKDVNNALNPTNLSNGIAVDAKNIFFWNVLGKVVAIGNLFMTVACKLSRKSVKQNMNVFCDNATLLLDSEGNALNDFTHFAIDQMVECDIVIISVNSELVWAATEVRKYPINYQKLYGNQKLAYNCEGMVKYHQLGVGRVIVMKSETNKSLECEMASYERNKVWFLKNDFPPANFDNRLKALDKVVFDAIQGADGKWKVHLIRKTLRPLPNLPIPEVQESPLVGENTIEKLQRLNEFHIEEMNEVRNSFNKDYDLRSKFANDDSNNFLSKLSTATQTISTGPIITVLGSVKT